MSPVLDEKSLLPEGRDRAFDSVLDPRTVPASAQGMAVGQRSTITLYLVKKGAGGTTFFCPLLLPESRDRHQLCAGEILGLSQYPACISLCQQDSLPSSFPSKAHILGSKVSEP